MMIEKQPVRLLKHQLEQALCYNLDKSYLPETVVHEMRRSFKKSRSYLRFYKFAISEELYLELDRKIGSIARSYTPFRESQVNLNIFNLYEKKLIKKVRKSTIQSIKEYLIETKHQLYCSEDLYSTLVASQQKIENILKYLNESPLPFLTSDDLLKQAKKAFKEAKAKYKLSKETEETEIVHDWRKSVKALLFQTSYLYEIEQHQNKVIIDLLAETGYLLGKDHDLAIMIDYLKNQISFNQLEEKKNVVNFFNERILKQRKKALETGATVFTLKSSRFLELINHLNCLQNHRHY